MLELRPNCECCDTDLAPDQAGAWICSFECTFCGVCAAERLGHVCPNCGGALAPRPVRPTALLRKHPAATRRVVRETACP